MMAVNLWIDRISHSWDANPVIRSGSPTTSGGLGTPAIDAETA